MAKATKTKVTETTQADPGISIPSIVPTPAAKKSGASLLAALASKTKPVENKTPSSKERPTLVLEQSTQEVFNEFAAVKELYDILEAKMSAIKDELNAELFTSWTTMLWNNKNVPENPGIKVKIDDNISEGMFVVQERIKLQIPDKADPAGSIIKLLVDLNWKEEDATKLVESEVDFTPQMALRPFNELVEGHYENKQMIPATEAEQAVGQKVLEFVMSLSPEEQELILINTPKTVIKKNFLARICSYAHSFEQVAALFKVFTPVIQNRGAKYAVNATPVNRVQLLCQKVEQLIGSAEDDTSDSDQNML